METKFVKIVKIVNKPSSSKTQDFICQFFYHFTMKNNFRGGKYTCLIIFIKKNIPTSKNKTTSKLKRKKKLLPKPICFPISLKLLEAILIKLILFPKLKYMYIKFK